MIDEKKYFRHALNVLDILQKRGGALEINTAGWFKKCAAPYPSAEIIREAKKAINTGDTACVLIPTHNKIKSFI